MVDPAARVLVQQGDRVEGRVVNSAPIPVVQVGQTTPGVRVQVKLGQAGQAGQADKVVRAFRVDRGGFPVNRAYIQSGKWSVPNRCQDKMAAAPIWMVVVVLVVVDAIVGAGQILAEGLNEGPAVRAIRNCSRVNFRGKRQRVDLRSNLGPRVSRVRKVFPVRQEFLGLLVEPAHRGRRANPVPRVIRMLRGRPTRRAPPVRPVHPAHLVLRGPLGLPVLHGSRDFRVMMAP